MPGNSREAQRASGFKKCRRSPDRPPYRAARAVQRLHSHHHRLSFWATWDATSRAVALRKVSATARRTRSAASGLLRQSWLPARRVPATWLKSSGCSGNRAGLGCRVGAAGQAGNEEAKEGGGRLFSRRPRGRLSGTSKIVCLLCGQPAVTGAGTFRVHRHCL